MGFKPNRFQEKVFYEIEYGDGHIVVIARAGTGKTTTICLALDVVPKGKSVLLSAFNKGIQTELAERAPKWVDVKTLHSLGFGCLRRNGKFRVDGDRTRKLIKDYLTTREIFVKGRQNALRRLIGLAKNTLASDREEIETLAYDYGIQDEDNQASTLAIQALDILERCKSSTAVIDFDDMIWLPAVHGIKPRRYDVVFVDEAQDLNKCQRWMIDQTIRDGGRLVAVGDPRQAIYKFRGAGDDVIKDLVETFKAKVLPLSITYRCPKKIVKIANEIVPDLEAADTAPDGTVDNKTWDECVSGAKPGCFILSRKNAPLMKICIALLKRGVSAQVAGKDLGKDLIALVAKSKTETVAALTAWLEKFQTNEAERLLPDNEKAYDLVCDKVDCLNAMMEGEAETQDVVRKLERIFSDNTDSTNVVMCSSVHKSKGLERPTVWVLVDTFRRGDSNEEDNLWYVAVTRSQDTLVLVTGE